MAGAFQAPAIPAGLCAGAFVADAPRWQAVAAGTHDRASNTPASATPNPAICTSDSVSPNPT